MTYEITRNKAGNHLVQEITPGEFATIREAQNFLLRRLATEQKYDILVRNFLDLEQTLSSITSKFLVRPFIREVESDDARASIDRALINFLSSARGYIDQSRTGLDATDLLTIKCWYAAEYDNSLAYRTMEALRNYTQHCGLPTHTITYHAHWENKEGHDRRKSIHSVIPSLTVAAFRKDKHFKSSVLKELNELGNEHPIMPLIRKYLAELSSVNIRLRQLQEDRRLRSLGDLERPVFTYVKLDKNSLGTGVVANEIDANGVIQDQIPLLARLGRQLVELQAVNGALHQLVVGQIRT